MEFQDLWMFGTARHAWVNTGKGTSVLWFYLLVWAGDVRVHISAAQMGLEFLWSLKHLEMLEYFSYTQISLTIACGSYQLSLCVIIASSKDTPDKMSRSSFPHLSDTHVSFPLPCASLCPVSQFSIPWHIFLNFPFCQQTCTWNKSLTLSSLLYQVHLACMRALKKYFICVVTFTPAGCNWKLWHYNTTVPSNLMLQRNPLRNCSKDNYSHCAQWQ